MNRSWTLKHRHRLLLKAVSILLLYTFSLSNLPAPIESYNLRRFSAKSHLRKPVSLPIDIETETKISDELRERAIKSHNVLNRQKYVEDLVETLEKSLKVQVAHFKIQNFKWFNSLGDELNIGHNLGDAALKIIGPEFKEYLTKELAGTEIEFEIYNDGPVYTLIFRNVSKENKPAVENAIRSLLKEDSKFKESVVRDIKQELNQELGIHFNMLDKEFSANEFNLYGGLSLIPEYFKFNIGAIELADKLDKEAAKAAKHTQIKFSDLYGETLAAILILFKEPEVHREKFTPTQLQHLLQHKILKEDAEDFGDDEYLLWNAISEEDLRNKLDKIFVPDKENIIAIWNRSKEEAKTAAGIKMQQLLEDAKLRKKSGVTVYSKEIHSQILLEEDFGLSKEYHNIHPPIYEVYDSRRTFNKLFDEYDLALAKHDSLKIAKARRALMRKMLLYRSKNIRGEEPIFKGNDSFKILINYIIRENPEEDLRSVFRIGGDEYGAVIWNAEHRTLKIMRVDGNNIGATTAEHGREIGDKIIDGQLLAINDILKTNRDITDIPGKIEEDFNYYPKTTVHYPITRLEETIRKKALEKSPQKIILMDREGNIYPLWIGPGRNGEIIIGSSKDEKVVEDNISKINGNRGPPVEIIPLNEWGIKVKGIILKMPINDYIALRDADKIEKRGDNFTVKVITGPMVSIGFVTINTDIIPEEDSSRDYSRIQGRADASSEKLKRTLKLFQIMHNGQIPLNNAVREAMPLKNKEIPTFPFLEMTPAQITMAKEMIAIIQEAKKRHSIIQDSKIEKPSDNHPDIDSAI